MFWEISGDYNTSDSRSLLHAAHSSLIFTRLDVECNRLD
jgi:hypothetical protein